MTISHTSIYTFPNFYGIKYPIHGREPIEFSDGTRDPHPHTAEEVDAAVAFALRLAEGYDLSKYSQADLDRTFYEIVVDVAECLPLDRQTIYEYVRDMFEE